MNRTPNSPLRSMFLVAAIAVALPVACTAQPPANPIASPPAATPAPPLVAGLPDFTNLVQRVGPAVVNIRAEAAPRRAARGQMPNEEQIPEIFRRFFGDEMPFPGGPGGPDGGPRGPRGGGTSLGSGFLMSADGYVMTNHHVVEGADTVTVTLSDRREFTAKVVGSDEQSDVALLKIDSKGLPFLRMAPANSAKAGQWVIAIGSPFGLDHSVTAGIVSAVGRANPYANQRYVPFIQTDVAINQGNSGGPLLNTSGEVVGINSQIFSNSGGYMGVSFAIPIDVAMSAAEQLRSTGKVVRGQLGIFVQELTSELAGGVGVSGLEGALIARVVPGGAADRAGIEGGDVVQSINGIRIASASDLPPVVGALKPGTKAIIGLSRGGKELDVTAVVEELGVENSRASAAGPWQESRESGFGFTAKKAPAQDLSRAGAPKGVVVTNLSDSASNAGLRVGDVITAVGRKSIESEADLNSELAKVADGKQAALLIMRSGQALYLAVPRT